MNKLILGDNFEVLKKLDDESIDLIYLDPPFFSNRNYEVIWGDKGEVRSFEDRFSGGIDHYIAWLKDRVQQMYRVLKPSGSIFLHCDWHANTYIRVYILDPIFGIDNFRGEIVWQRHNSHNDAKKKLAVLKDTIWYYSKSAKFTYNPTFTSLSEKYIADFYKFDDRDGRGLYRLDNMSAPAGGGMSQIMTNTGKPRGWYEYKGYQPPEKGWRYSIETMDQLDSEGKIYYPKNKNGDHDFTKRLALKRYLKDQQGQLVGDVWTDIQNLQAHSKERIGYPTQKPEALLERIIAVASNEGDVVLDPFVGGGTTIAVADKMKRKWVGVDQSVAAIKVTEMRLNNQQGLFSDPFILTLHKYDYDTLRYQDAFEFETFMVQQFGGTANTRQRGDMGLDGKARNGTPIQVKRSENVGRNVVDNFLSAVKRYDKTLFEQQIAKNEPVGTIIAFSFAKGAIQEVARLKNSENTIIELKEVKDIVEIAKKPTITLNYSDAGMNKKLREIAFGATAQSDSGIEFYAWDWDYNGTHFKPEILMDKEGKQTKGFKAGTHTIAVKAVDNDGLEAIEVVKLKINGDINQIQP